MPYRKLNAIDARLLTAELAAKRELRRLGRARQRMDRYAKKMKRSTVMSEIKQDTNAPKENAIAIGFLLGGLCLVAALMALFAPLDSKGNASTLKPSPARYFEPR